MIDTKGAPYGALLLRVSLGILFLAHGLYLKVFVFGLPGTAQYFGSLGLPGWFGYLVPLYETLGGLALIFGFYGRYVAFLLGLHMLVATYMGHSGNGWMFANQGGGWEFPLFWALALFALALMGDGAYALRSSRRVA